MCNDHAFDALDRFVDAGVVVNGRRQGLADYVAGLRSVIADFPEFRWEVEHLLVEEPWIAVHFRDRLGAPRDGVGGRGPSTRQEFAFYRVTNGKIVEVWVGTDSYDR